MQGHKYFVFVTGIDATAKEFATRRDAEIYMHQICYKQKLQNLECIECDKHERKYVSKTNGQKVVFYINRV